MGGDCCHEWNLYAAGFDQPILPPANALGGAVALIQLDPEDPLGWFHRSSALHELKRTAEARDDLLHVVDKFPISATMRYSLACYERQLGRLDQAENWLGEAFELGDPQTIKFMALEDPNLEPLWKKIGEI